jgi:hypothetical protein
MPRRNIKCIRAGTLSAYMNHSIVRGAASYIICLAAAVALLSLRYQTLVDTYAFNRVARDAVQVVMLGFKPGAVDSALAKLELRNCRANWYRGIITDYATGRDLREQYFSEAIRCSTTYVEMARNALPGSELLANQAVILHPDNPDGWLWLAQLREEGEPARAISLYRRGLALKQYDARSWRALGDLLVEETPEEAVQAYVRSCIYGDPGNHGCWRAGRVAELLGDVPAAIRYYRFSRWLVARDRADELERLHSQ